MTMSVLRRESAVWTLIGLAAGSLAVMNAFVPAGAATLVLVAGIAVTWWLLNDATAWPKVFLVTALLLPPIPAPWGDSGVHVAPLVAALGFWAGVLRPNEWQFRADRTSVSLLLFGVMLAASVPFALLYSGVEIAAGSLARVGLFGLSVYLFLYVAFGPGRRIPTEQIVAFLFWTGLASAAFAVLDFYFQFPAPARFAEQMVWLNEGVFRRAQGVFYEASTLGMLCALLLVLSASVLAMRMTKDVRLPALWVLIGSAVFLSALVFSFSRAAVLNIAAAGLAMVVLLRHQFRPGWRTLRLALAGACGIAAGFVLAQQLFPRYVEAYVARLEQSSEFLLTEPNHVLSRRLETWTSLAQYVTGTPERLLWGIGYKTLPYTESVGRGVVTDNMYLSLLVETGLPGLAALLLLCAAVLAQSHREATRGATKIRRLCGTCLFCFWIGLMVQMMSGDILTYWRVLPPLFLLIAIGARHEDPDPRPVQ